MPSQYDVRVCIGAGGLTVGASSIKNNLEFLRGGADSYLREVYTSSVDTSLDGRTQNLHWALRKFWGVTLAQIQTQAQQIEKRSISLVDWSTYADRNRMATIYRHFLDFEHLLINLLGANAHILLSKGPHMGMDVVARLNKIALAQGYDDHQGSK